MSMPTKLEQSEHDKASDRQEIKITRATNGYTVRAWPDLFVYRNLEEVIDHLKVHFSTPTIKRNNERQESK